MSGEPAQAAVAGDKDSASQPALPSIPKEVTRIDLRCDIVGVGAASRTFYPDGQVQGSHTGGGSVSEQKAKLDAKTLADIWAKAEALVPDYHGVQQKPDPSWHRYFSLILRLRDGTYIVIVWQTEPPGRVKELSDLLFSQEVGYW